MAFEERREGEMEEDEFIVFAALVSYMGIYDVLDWRVLTGVHLFGQQQCKMVSLFLHTLLLHKYSQELHD